MPKPYELTPIEERSASMMVKDYRDSTTTPSNTKLAICDFTTLGTIQEFFSVYTSQFPLPSPYEWKGGLCPMHFNDNGVVKLSFSILPVIINTVDEAEVYDYFESKDAGNSFYVNYFAPLLQKVMNETGKSFIFDDAHLWP
jgi:hypothetical protein